MPFRETIEKPRIRFTEKELPEVKNQEINQKYTL